MPPLIDPMIPISPQKIQYKRAQRGRGRGRGRDGGGRDGGGRDGGQIRFIEVATIKKVEKEGSEEDVDIDGDTESMSNFGQDESDDSETGLSSSGGSDSGDGGGQDIEMPQVGDVLDAKGGDEEEGEDEQVLRDQIRSLEDLVVNLRQRQMDDREHFRRAYGALEAKRDQITRERDHLQEERDHLQQERDAVV